MPSVVHNGSVPFDGPSRLVPFVAPTEPPSFLYVLITSHADRTTHTVFRDDLVTGPAPPLIRKKRATEPGSAFLMGTGLGVLTRRVTLE